MIWCIISIPMILMWQRKRIRQFYMNKEEFLKEYNITESFLNYAIECGVLRNDFSFEDLLDILVVFKNGKPLMINNGFVIKENRKALISKYGDNEKQEPKQEISIDIPKERKNKFTLKKMGDKKLKLVKL